MLLVVRLVDDVTPYLGGVRCCSSYDLSDPVSTPCGPPSFNWSAALNKI